MTAAGGGEPRGVPGAPAPGAPILYFDAGCACCSRGVMWVLRRDRRGTLRVAGRRSAAGLALESRRPEFAGVESLLWQDGGPVPGEGRVRVRSEAVLAVLCHLGSGWRMLAALARAIPRPLRDAAYDGFARRRHHAAGCGAACPAPPAWARERFVDASAGQPNPDRVP